MAAQQNNQPRTQSSKTPSLYWQVITTETLLGPPFPENPYPRFPKPVVVNTPKTPKK